MRELREACAAVAAVGRHVHIQADAIPAYAASLRLEDPAPPPDPEAHLLAGTREELAAFWLTLDAINFGSGWFPTLRKRPGRSGYFTIAIGIRTRFAQQGPWSPAELVQIDATAIARVLGQDPKHELMELFARSLRNLGGHVSEDHGGSYGALVASAGDSAVRLARRLGAWASFADSPRYDGIVVPFMKRAQIVAADLSCAGAASFGDID